MTSLSSSVDDAYLSEMAERFAPNAYSCLGQHTAASPPLEPAQWLQGVVGKEERLQPGAIQDTPQLRVERALALQAGPAWNGIDAQNPIRKAGLLLLSAHAAGHDIGDELADMNHWALGLARAQANAVSTDAIPGTSPAIAPIGPMSFVRHATGHAAMPLLQRVEAAHGRSNTVAWQLVGLAKRAQSVLSSAHFLWLRDVDRMLWLLVNDYGRVCHLVETLGVVAHHRAEVVVGRPLDSTTMTGPARAVMACAA